MIRSLEAGDHSCRNDIQLFLLRTSNHLNSIQRSQFNGQPQIRRPSSEEFWSMVQRLLTFEEPVSRLCRIRRLLSHHTIKPKLKLTQLAQMPQSEQDKLFSNIFGRANYDLAGSLLNFSLVQEDLNRFKNITFESWYLKNQRLAETGSIPGVSEPQFMPLFRSTIKQYTLAEQEWLIHSLSAVPDWLMLKAPGSWSTDPRVLFLMECYEDNVRIIKKYPSHATTKLYEETHTHFCQKLRHWRQKLPGNFLPHGILLVEGTTEALLIPHFASMIGISFDALGIAVIPAGGANQVARRYLHMKELTSLPIVCILDKDANTQARLLNENLRETDRMYILQGGEIEDIFETKTLTRLIKSYGDLLYNQELNPVLLDTHLLKTASHTGQINQMWRKNGLGDFDKIDFAKFLIKHLCTEELPEEARAILQSVLEIIPSRRKG